MGSVAYVFVLSVQKQEKDVVFIKFQSAQNVGFLKVTLTVTKCSLKKEEVFGCNQQKETCMENLSIILSVQITLYQVVAMFISHCCFFLSSQLFVIGKPAYLYSTDDIDWVPTLNLGSLIQKKQCTSTSTGISCLNLFQDNVSVERSIN